MNILERIYLLGHRYRTSTDLKGQRRLPVPVISIGNITTGGTGKTPAVIALAMEARARGFRPCVLTRGYGGRLRGPLFVSEENYARDVGDEPLLIASRLHDVPVVKCPDRYKGGMFALDNLDSLDDQKKIDGLPDLFILDDGFQHRRLQRDMDVLLVSALEPFGRGRLLPAGRLREPLSGIGRADVIVITKTEATDPGAIEEIRKTIAAHNPGAPVFLSTHGPTGVLLGVSPHESASPRADLALIDWLKGRRVFAFSAVAGPESFIETLRQAGADVAGSRSYRDHHVFSHGDLRDIRAEAQRAGAGWIMTTEKDIMRLRALEGQMDNIGALIVDFMVEKDFYDRVLDNPGRSDA